MGGELTKGSSRKGKAQFTPTASHILTGLGSALPSVPLHDFPPEQEIMYKVWSSPLSDTEI